MSIWKNGKLIAGGRQCMPLLSFMWADHVLNDASWLRADTFSWQNGAVYQAAYQHLVDDYNNTGEHLYGWSTDTFSKTPYPSVGDVLYRSDGTEWSTVAYVAADYSYIIRSDGVAQLNRNTSIDTVLYETHTETIAGVTITYYQASDGHKLVLPDQESNVTAIYNATGVAWYYIIDTINERFKLPRTKFGFTGIRTGVGGYVEAGLPNITGDITSGLSNNVSGMQSFDANGAFQVTATAWTQYFDRWGDRTGASTINLNASRSSSVYGNSDTVQPKATEMYLYFYVGNFTQTALENTAGLNAELFNEKADLSTVAHVVTEFQEPTSSNNYTWYRKYADGWVEQGGYTLTNSNPRTVTFPVEMADTNYQVLANVKNSSDNTAVFTLQPRTLSTTGMVVYCTYSAYHGSGEAGEFFYWQVSGMAAN